MSEFGAARGLIRETLNKLKWLEDLEQAMIKAESAEGAEREALARRDAVEAAALGRLDALNVQVADREQQLRAIEAKISTAMDRHTETIRRLKDEADTAKANMNAELEAQRKDLERSSAESDAVIAAKRAEVELLDAKVQTLQGAYDALKAKLAPMIDK